MVRLIIRLKRPGDPITSAHTLKIYVQMVGLKWSDITYDPCNPHQVTLGEFRPAAAQDLQRRLGSSPIAEIVTED